MPAWLLYLDTNGTPRPRVLFGYPGAVKPELGETEKHARRLGPEIRITDNEEAALALGAIDLDEIVRRYPLTPPAARPEHKIVLGGARG